MHQDDFLKSKKQIIDLSELELEGQFGFKLTRVKKNRKWTVK